MKLWSVDVGRREGAGERASGELNRGRQERERERAFRRSPRKGRPGNRVRGGPGYVNGTEVGWRAQGAAGERRRDGRGRR